MGQDLLGTIGTGNCLHPGARAGRGAAPGAGRHRGVRGLVGRAGAQAQQGRCRRVHVGAFRLRHASALMSTWEPRMFFWHVPAPNEALLISGSKRQAAGHAVPDRDRPRLLRHAGQAEGPGALAGASGSGDRRGLHHQPGHPPQRPGRRGVQGRGRPGVDRQRRPPVPVRAGPDGGPGRPDLRRAPPVHRRRAHGRADRQGTGPGGPGGQGRQPRRDGEAGHRRGCPGDPGDRGLLRLHQQPGRPARRGGGQPGAHRPRASRPAGGRAGAGRPRR